MGFELHRSDALLVCRATVTPFLANMTVGRNNFKWMLFGDDDTVGCSLLSVPLHRASLLSDVRLHLLLLVLRWLLLHGAMLPGMAQPGMFQHGRIWSTIWSARNAALCLGRPSSTAPTAGCPRLLRRCVTCDSLLCRFS